MLGHRATVVVESTVDGMRDEMMLAMLNTLQAAAATCATICEQRIRKLHKEMQEALEEEHRRYQARGESFTGGMPPVIASPFITASLQIPQGPVSPGGESGAAATSFASMFAMDAGSSDSEGENHDDGENRRSSVQSAPIPTALLADCPVGDTNGQAQGAADTTTKKASLTEVGRSAMNVGSGLAKSALRESKRAATVLKQGTLRSSRGSVHLVTGSSGSATVSSTSADHSVKDSSSRVPTHHSSLPANDCQALDVKGDLPVPHLEDENQPFVEAQGITPDAEAHDFTGNTGNMQRRSDASEASSAAQSEGASAEIGAEARTRGAVPSREKRKPLPAASVYWRGGDSTPGGSAGTPTSSKSRHRKGDAASSVPSAEEHTAKLSAALVPPAADPPTEQGTDNSSAA